jgi:hypothetical protein
MERRRTLSNNKNNKVDAYGGIITFSERPTEAVTFECPGCTYFAIMPLNADIVSGKFGALFINVTAIKDDYVADVKTYPTGKGGWTCNAYKDKMYAGTNPNVSFTDTGVTMELADYSDSTYAWFGGFSYTWIAW